MALPQISEIGRILKDQSILKHSFRRPKPDDVVYDLDRGVVRLRKEKIPEMGTIYLTPEEERYAERFRERGIQVEIPKT